MIRMTAVTRMIIPNMDVYSNVVLFIVLHLVKSEDCVIDNRSPQIAWEQQLRKDLISCANRDLPPDTVNTNVSLAFVIKSFYFDKKEEVFSINSWLFIIWSDPRLKWNSSDYDGITKLVISSNVIWTPTMKLYNAPGYDDIEFFMTTCNVLSRGKVICMEQLLNQVTCRTKLNDWPYDRQNCTFRFGPRNKNSGITFKFNSSRSLSISESENSPSWDIIGHSSGHWNISPMQFYFSFLLERHGVGLAATIIAPSLVLSALTVLSMSLNVEDKVRLGIQCFSLMCQFFFMQEISNDIPKHSADTPTILFYLRTSVVLTLLAIGITFLLSHLHRRTAPPPNSVVALCDRLFEPYGKYFIWPRWKTVKVEVSSVWIDFASIVNFVFNLVVTIMYVTMYFAYVPRKQ